MALSSEMAEEFEARRKASQEKRKKNRESSPQMLKAAGVSFETKNNGAHLIVPCSMTFIDFWPGTGLWIPRDTQQRGRGVENLIKYLRVHC